MVGWGSTLGSIEEAVDRLRAAGHRVSSLHIRFISPLEPGLSEIFSKFRKVMTVELNFSDPPVHPLLDKENRRRAQLCRVLRERTLVDVDCWSEVPGQPLPPGKIYNVLVEHLRALKGEAVCSA